MVSRYLGRRSASLSGSGLACRSGVSERAVIMSAALALTSTTAGSLDWHCDVGKLGECEVDEVAGGCSLAEEQCDEQESLFIPFRRTRHATTR